MTSALRRSQTTYGDTALAVSESATGFDSQQRALSDSAQSLGQHDFVDGLQPKRRLFEVPDVNLSTAEAVARPATHVKTIPQRTTSVLLAEWHGQVTEVLAATFIAQLKGRHGEAVAGSEDIAVIPIEEVRESDRDLLQTGAFFRLCIAYEISQQGNRRRYTEVVFRRLPAFRREELEQAQAVAREIASELRLE